MFFIRWETFHTTLVYLHYILKEAFVLGSGFHTDFGKKVFLSKIKIIFLVIRNSKG